MAPSAATAARAGLWTPTFGHFVKSGIQQLAVKARVPSYRVAERFGVVWVCLGDPEVELPEYPEYDDPSYRTVFVGAQDWNAGAARMMENFMDTGHLAWVHPGVLGDERRPHVNVSPVTALPNGIAFSAANEVVGEGGAWQTEPVDYTFTLPYFFRVVRERVRVVADVEREPFLEPRYVLIIAIQPIGPALSRRYTWVSRNYAKDPALDDRFEHFLLKLAEQDRRIVELQRPERLPLDITAEMHIRTVDAPAIAFRRLLADRGLEESALPKPSNVDGSDETTRRV